MSTMNVDRFLEIEEKYRLFDLEVEGVRYWAYHRTAIWNFEICIQKYGMQAKRESARKRRAFWLREAIIPLHIPQRTDILFLNHPRRIKIGDWYDSIYTEDLATLYNYTTAIEVTPSHGSTNTKIRTKNMLHIAWHKKRNKLLARLYVKANKRKTCKIYQTIKHQILPALLEISQAYQWAFDEQKVLAGFVNTIIYNKIAKGFYKELIKKIKPRLIVEVVGYNNDRMLINEIAKEMGIPTIELQHGNMFDNHLAYQYGTKEQIPTFPDYLFLFSDFWKTRIRVPIQDDHLISVGFPHYEKMREMARNKVKVSSNRRYTILFISQETIGVELSECAMVLRKLLSQDDYHIIFKLHTAEYKDIKTKYTMLCDSSVEVIGDNNENIYELFCRSDMQIGSYSTAVYEGIGFGLYTLILTIGLYDAMKPLVDAGMAHYVSTPEEIVKIAEEKPVSKEDSEILWPRNALQNMKNQIDIILEEQEQTDYMA